MYRWTWVAMILVPATLSAATVVVSATTAVGNSTAKQLKANRSCLRMARGEPKENSTADVLADGSGSLTVDEFQFINPLPGFADKWFYKLKTVSACPMALCNGSCVETDFPCLLDTEHGVSGCAGQSVCQAHP